MWSRSSPGATSSLPSRAMHADRHVFSMRPCEEQAEDDKKLHIVGITQCCAMIKKLHIVGITQCCAMIKKLHIVGMTQCCAFAMKLHIVGVTQCCASAMCSSPPCKSAARSCS
jgi:hypothetical protein